MIAVTANETVSSNTARPLFIDESTVRVFYLSKEKHRLWFNVAYRDVDLRSGQVGGRVDLTNLSSSHASHLNATKTAQGRQIVGYLSREYCDSAGCSVDKPTVRSSLDSFASPKYYLANLDCGATVLQVVTRPQTEDIHLFALLSTAGACQATSAGGGNVLILADQGTSQAQSRFFLTHAVSLSLGVKANGEQNVFYHSIWDGGCSSWALYSRSSAENFATARLMPRSCRIDIGYPGTWNSPGVLSSGNTIYVSFTSNGSTPSTPGTLVVSSSDDAFAGTVLSAQPLSGSFGDIAVESLPDGTVYVAAVESAGPQAGVNLFRRTAPGERVAVSPKTNGGGYLSYSPYSGPIVSYLSPLFCKVNGCRIQNWMASLPQLGQMKQLTTLTDEQSHFGRGFLHEKVLGSFEFIYSSNEQNVSFLNISRRQSGDQFAARSAVTSDSDYNSSLFYADLDQAGVLHILSEYNFDRIGYARSDQNFNRVKVNSGSAWGPWMTVDRATGRSAVFYGGNETGSWRANFRTSDDTFATKRLTLNNNMSAYSSRDSAFKPNGDITVGYLGDENGDSVRQVSLRYSGDNYQSYSEPFILSGGALCSSIALAYETNDRLFVSYSIKRSGEDFCRVEARASDDWSRYWVVAQSQTADHFAQKIFFSPTLGPLACWNSSFEIGCTKLNQVSRQ